jgi:hypothetical protein
MRKTVIFVFYDPILRIFPRALVLNGIGVLSKKSEILSAPVGW